MGESVGYLSGAAVLITAIVSALVAYLRTRHKLNQERDVTAVGHLSGIVDRQERQIERLQTHAVQMAETVEDLWLENANCHDGYAELSAGHHVLYDQAARMAARLSKLGEDPGPLQPLQPRRARPDRDRQEERMRALKQNTVLLTQQQQSPPPAPPGGQP